MDEVTGEWRRLHNEELLRSVLFTKYYSGDRIKENEMGDACSTDGGRGAYRVLVWGLREGDHLEDLGVDERMIFKCIFKKWDGGMDWIDVAQDRDRWRALANAVMNLRVA